MVSLKNYLACRFPNIPVQFREPIIVATFTAAWKASVTHLDAVLEQADARTIYARKALARWSHCLSAIEPPPNVYMSQVSTAPADGSEYSPGTSFWSNENVTTIEVIEPQHQQVPGAILLGTIQPEQQQVPGVVPLGTVELQQQQALEAFRRTTEEIIASGSSGIVPSASTTEKLAAAPGHLAEPAVRTIRYERLGAASEFRDIGGHSTSCHASSPGHNRIGCYRRQPVAGS